MSGNTRGRFLPGACIMALVGAMVWCASTLQLARDRAQSAVDELRACRSLAAQIEVLRHRGGVVGGTREIEVTDLARRIDAARAAAGIADGSVVRIEPQEPRRVGDSPLMEKLTLVLLRQVTVKQCVTFLHAIGTDRSGLEASEVHLTDPAVAGQDAEQWTANITLRNVTYSPLPRAPVAAGALAKTARLD
jgi:hypothetical protein